MKTARKASKLQFQELYVVQEVSESQELHSEAGESKIQTSKLSRILDSTSKHILTSTGKDDTFSLFSMFELQKISENLIDAKRDLFRPNVDIQRIFIEFNPDHYIESESRY
jgi:hypothetical protein